MRCLALVLSIYGPGSPEVQPTILVFLTVPFSGGQLEAEVGGVATLEGLQPSLSWLRMISTYHFYSVTKKFTLCHSNNMKYYIILYKYKKQGNLHTIEVEAFRIILSRGVGGG